MASRKQRLLGASSMTLFQWRLLLGRLQCTISNVSNRIRYRREESSQGTAFDNPIQSTQSANLGHFPEERILPCTNSSIVSTCCYSLTASGHRNRAAPRSIVSSDRDRCLIALITAADRFVGLMLGDPGSLPDITRKSVPGAPIETRYSPTMCNTISRRWGALRCSKR